MMEVRPHGIKIVARPDVRKAAVAVHAVRAREFVRQAQAFKGYEGARIRIERDNLRLGRAQGIVQHDVRLDMQSEFGLMQPGPMRGTARHQLPPRWLQKSTSSASVPIPASFSRRATSGRNHMPTPCVGSGLATTNSAACSTILSVTAVSFALPCALAEDFR